MSPRPNCSSSFRNRIRRRQVRVPLKSRPEEAALPRCCWTYCCTVCSERCAAARDGRASAGPVGHAHRHYSCSSTYWHSEPAVWRAIGKNWRAKPVPSIVSHKRDKPRLSRDSGFVFSLKRACIGFPDTSLLDISGFSAKLGNLASASAPVELWRVRSRATRTFRPGLRRLLGPHVAGGAEPIR